jgi:hypothetical protein
MFTGEKLRLLADRWAGARPAERANAQSYLRELAEALGVEPPRPSGSGYEFEYAVRADGQGGSRDGGVRDGAHGVAFAGTVRNSIRFSIMSGIATRFRFVSRPMSAGVGRSLYTPVAVPFSNT